MSDERARRREEIFGQAVSLVGQERQRLLDDRCASDAELRKEIDLLLRHHAAVPSGFLQGDPPRDREGGGAAARSIGAYRILREIGRGGQGVVYLARDTRLPRQVALKVLESGSLATPEHLLRFRREAEVASKLDHPGICSVYEAGVDSDVPYIAMRYVEGETLAHKIAAARRGEGRDWSSYGIEIPESIGGPGAPQVAAVPEPSASTASHATTRAQLMGIIQVFEKAARALHVAHEAGVIHRDIKPGNIMVTPGGEPVILDFGLARDLDVDAVTLTRSGGLFGTPSYMSPEQLTRGGIRLDCRTDVYSLGVALYESLTLRRPFDDPTREGLYQAILTRSPVDPRQLNAAIPRDLKVVLEVAMEKNRDRRYQTALDLAEDLRRVREIEPISAKPATALERLGRWSQRNPALATAVSGLCVALVISVILLIQARAERDAKNVALLQVSAERNEKQAALSDFERLGDLSRLQKLAAEADTLWPAEAGKVSAMKAWVQEAAELERRLGGHTEVLDRLRMSALPYTSEEVARDLAAQSRPATTSAPSSRRTNERLTWTFQTPFDQFRHDTTLKLVKDLAAFLDPDPQKGLITNVKARLRFAESVEQETLWKFEAEWAEAVRSIADRHECPKYGGLKIVPQRGLIPISKDSASGLWEFAHLETSAPGVDPIPKRDATGKLVVASSMGLVFVLIPGGQFRMGAIRSDEETEPNADPGAFSNEAPVTEVSLDPFFMSKYEMTQGHWLRVVRRNPSLYPPGMRFTNDGAERAVDLRNPVEQVSWQDCNVWLTRLGLVLPTEAQWEYAARGGTTTPRWTGLGTDGLGKAANLADDFARTHGGPSGWIYESWDDGCTAHAAVGSFEANPFGLHDVLGNVCEWCRDRFGRYEMPVDRGDGLRHPSESGYRVFRGGSWSHDAASARSAFRFQVTADFRANLLGVRPARAMDR